jgi:hypothetical protein
MILMKVTEYLVLEQILIIILFKTEFPFLEIRSEPLGQHLPKVKDSNQEGPLPFMPGRLKSNINI